MGLREFILVCALGAVECGIGSISTGMNGFALVTDGSLLRKVDLVTREVSTVASLGVFGGVSLSCDGTYALYLQENVVKKVVFMTGVVSVLAGSGSYGYREGIGVDADFNGLKASRMSRDCSYAFVIDRLNYMIRKINLNTKEVSYVVGSPQADSALYPDTLAISPDESYMLVGEVWSVKKVNLLGSVRNITVIAGTPLVSGYSDGQGTLAKFQGILDIDISSDGAFAIVSDDFNNHLIRKINLVTNVVSTLHSSTSWVRGLSIMPFNSLAIFNGESPHQMYQISTETGVVSVLAGNANYLSQSDGIGTSANFQALGSIEVWRCGLPGRGFYASENVCDLCPIGFYGAYGQCLPCKADSYSVVSGTSACTPCSTSCAPGFYKYKACTATANVGCASCDVGYFCAGSSTSPVPCLPGSYTNAPMSGACTPCEAGRYGQAGAATVCSLCPAGWTSAAGATVCSQCPAGSYSEQAGAGACTRCGAGMYSAVSGLTVASSCEACPVNKFASQSGSTACVSCSGGTYASARGMSACARCTPGNYDNGVSACVACAAGTYSTGYGEFLGGCVKCNAGKYSAVAGLSSELGCVACVGLTYASAAGSVGCQSCSVCNNGYMARTDPVCSPTTDTICVLKACLLCEPGLYVVNSCANEGERAVCSSCPTGTYSSETGRATACTRCAGGTFASAVGATVCGSCAGGTFASVTGATACVGCASGTFASVTGATACTRCAGGTFASAVGATVCVGCVGGTFASAAGATACAACVFCSSAGKFKSGCGGDSEGLCVDCSR